MRAYSADGGSATELDRLEQLLSSRSEQVAVTTQSPPAAPPLMVDDDVQPVADSAPSARSSSSSTVTGTALTGPRSVAAADSPLPLPTPATTHTWRRGVVVSGVRRTNEVNARRARLVLGWVTVFGRVYHLGM